ncbi:MAG TPA: glycosyltransferase family 39 protein [Candidatus Eremiobacteraeota bacterium]|nr:MAG: hypothetical protein BWY64_00956 [bacterium ADurb.Bin363]HPZ08742.1 glycosyltransferase family 39 protein [Candidatus Eremiobacteraeota bacterium]
MSSFIKNRFKNYKLQDILFIIWIIFFLYINLLWLKIDQRPPRWDESMQLFISEYSYQNLKHFNIIGALKTDNISNTKPGFIPFLSGLCYFLTGHSTKVAIFILNSISFLIILISIYMIGKIIFDSTAGLLGSIVFTCYKGIFMWSRYYTLDIPLTASVALTVLLSVLIYRNEFKNKVISVLLGLTVMSGICIKHLYAAFVFFPVLFLFILSFTGKGKKIKIIIIERWHFFLFLSTGILLGSFYHILNQKIVLEQLARNFNPGATGIAWYKPLGTFEYLWSFKSWMLGGNDYGNLFVAIFFIGFIFSFSKLSKELIFLYLWTGGIFFFLLFLIYAQSPCYFSPLMPVFALISFSWVSCKPTFNKKVLNNIIQGVKILVIIFIFISSTGYYLGKSLGTVNIFKIITRSPSVVFNSGRVKVNPFVKNPYWIKTYVDGNVATLPYPQYWYMDEMLDEVEDSIKSTSEKPLILATLVAEYEWMTCEYTLYKVWQRGLNDRLEVVRIYAPGKDISEDVFLSGFDFLILKTGKIAKNDFYTTGNNWATETQLFVEYLLADNGKVLRNYHFELLKDFPLPDGSRGSLWMKYGNKYMNFL